MTVNAIFDSVKVYDVQSRLDIVKGQKFAFEVTTGEEFVLFTDNDPVLSVGTGLKISADEIGLSRLRFMSGASVLKDIDIQVVDHTAPNATALNGNLGEPVSK